MAYTLRRYSPQTDKRGFYINHPNHTFQTTHRVDAYFRENNYGDYNDVPKTVVKTLVHLDEVYTEGRTSKHEMVDWVGPLSPQYCEMSPEQLETLRDFAKSSLKQKGVSRSEFDELNELLAKETSMSQIDWRNAYSKE